MNKMIQDILDFSEISINGNDRKHKKDFIEWVDTYFPELVESERHNTILYSKFFFYNKSIYNVIRKYYDTDKLFRITLDLYKLTPSSNVLKFIKSKIDGTQYAKQFNHPDISEHQRLCYILTLIPKEFIAFHLL